MFELNTNKFNLTLNEKGFIFQKEDEDSVFYLSKEEDDCISYIYLKKENVRFDIKVIKCSIEYSNNKYILEYNIESDEVNTKILIEL